MSITETLKNKCSEIQVTVSDVDYKSRGYHFEIQVPGEKIRDLATVMIDCEFYLDLVTAVHAESAFQIVYQFAKFDEPCRVNAKVLTDASGTVSTISDIYHGADWHERETHDFYGIKFDGHPDMRPLLLSDDDADLKPLLKSEKKLKSVEDITRKSEDKSEDKPEKKKE